MTTGTKDFYVKYFDEGLNNALNELTKLVGTQYGPQILHHEAGQVLVSAVRMGNKLIAKNEHRGKPNETAKVIRERSVLRAISNTMRPISGKAFKNPQSRKAWNRVLESGDLGLFNEISKRMPDGSPLHNQTAVYFNQNVHRSRIGHMGRISQDYRQRVLGTAQEALWNQYVKTVKGRVGWKEAGWMQAADALGVTSKIPGFIRRHTGAPGAIQQDFETFAKPSILMVNGSNKDPLYFPRVQGALRVRMKAIATKCRRLIQGKAVSLGFTTNAIPPAPEDWN